MRAEPATHPRRAATIRAEPPPMQRAATHVTHRAVNGVIRTDLPRTVDDTMTVHKRNTSEAWNDDDWTGDSSTTSPSDDDAIRLDDTAFDTPEPGDELDDEWGSDGEDSFGTGDYELEERYALRRWPGSRPSSRTSPRSSTGGTGSSGWCSPASGPKAPSRTPTTPWPSSRLLAETAGSQVLEALSQRRRKPDPATYIGPGKVDYLRAVVAETGADTVICDGELSPAQLAQPGGPGQGQGR